MQKLSLEISVRGANFAQILRNWTNVQER